MSGLTMKALAGFVRSTGMGRLGNSGLGEEYVYQAGGWVKVIDDQGEHVAYLTRAQLAARQRRQWDALTPAQQRAAQASAPAGRRGGEASGETRRREERTAEAEAGVKWWGDPYNPNPDLRTGMREDPPVDPRTGNRVKNQNELSDLLDWMQSEGINEDPPTTREGWKALAAKVRQRRREERERDAEEEEEEPEVGSHPRRDQAREESREQSDMTDQELQDLIDDPDVWWWRKRMAMARLARRARGRSSGAGRTGRPRWGRRSGRLISSLPPTVIRTYPSPRIVRQAPSPPPPPPPPPTVSLARQRYAAARAATLLSQPLPGTTFATGPFVSSPYLTPSLVTSGGVVVGGGALATPGPAQTFVPGTVNGLAGLGRRPASHTLVGGLGALGG